MKVKKYFLETKWKKTDKKRLARHKQTQSMNRQPSGRFDQIQVISSKFNPKKLNIPSARPGQPRAVAFQPNLARAASNPVKPSQTSQSNPVKQCASEVGWNAGESPAL
ncbi:MAG: hypothetical protein ABSA47_03585 [Verrucomicrobiota bacterium]|jgi:hypothetical protein